MRYIKLSKATDDHGYIAEYYTKDGIVAKTEAIELSKLDKLVSSKIKIRCKPGQEWGLIIHDRSGAVSSILPVAKPRHAIG